MMHRALLLLLGLSLTFDMAPAAAGDDPTVLFDGVVARYRALGDFEVAFTQRYLDAVGTTSLEESGTLLVARDGRFRWSYAKPEEKVFLFDLHKAYFYEPKVKQVTILADFADSPLAAALAFLAGRAPPLDDYRLEPCPSEELLCKVEVGQGSIKITPKQQVAKMRSLVVVVDKQPAMLKRAYLVDALGNQTHYSFTTLKPLKSIDPTLLTFTQPKGVAVIRTSL